MNKVIFQIYPHFINKMKEFYLENENIKKADIVFVGDSLTEMYDLSTLNIDKYNVVNRGIVSDKSAGVLISFDDRVLALNPKLVFMLIGSNDICDGYTINQIITNIENIINKLEEKNISLILSTVLPPCYHQGEHVDRAYPDCRDINRIEELNNRIFKLKEKYQNITIFDAYSILTDEHKSLKVDETLDGVHLTKSAYEKLTKEIKPLLIKVIEGEM